MLPAAIEQDILLALHTTDCPTVKLANLEPRFKPCTFDLTPPSSANSSSASAQTNGHSHGSSQGHGSKGPGWHVDFISPAKGGGWENYVKVATAECLDAYFGPGSEKQGEPKGMELVVSGTVPPGSGLSVSRRRDLCPTGAAAEGLTAAELGCVRGWLGDHLPCR